MKRIGVDLYQHLLGVTLRVERGDTVERCSPELNLGITLVAQARIRLAAWALGLRASTRGLRR